MAGRDGGGALGPDPAGRGNGYASARRVAIARSPLRSQDRASYSQKTPSMNVSRFLLDAAPRFRLAAGMLAALIGSSGPAHSSQVSTQAARPAIDLSGRRDFDFLFGQWKVRHRRLKAGSNEWVEFDGTCSNRALLDGSANVEEHTLDAPSGGYRAVALRAYDSTTGQWAIWWLDGRYPHGTLDPPVTGRFESGVGRFYSDYLQDGKPMRVRFLWSRITPTSARWEQASSSDGGKTWDTNWIMEFRRAQEAPGTAQPASNVPGVHDFDFLRGDWRVRHRYLRAATGEWVEVAGTCSNRPLMGGWANLEEHWVHAPAGAYRALGLRSYDPTTARWAIWWLDGRSPHGGLDPPLTGRFEKDVGTFFGTTTLNGKAVGIRFVWSQITSTSARWEQAYSSDDGKIWEAVWTMEFRRAS